MLFCFLALIKQNADRLKKEQDERKKAEDAEKKHQKEMADIRKMGVEKAIEYLKQVSAEREKQIDKEITASQKLEDKIKAGTIAGTDTAEQSLAEQEKITRDKVRLKEEEAKKQQDLEKLKVAYQLFEQFLAKGDNVPTATAKTGAGIKVFEF